MFQARHSNHHEPSPLLLLDIIPHDGSRLLSAKKKKKIKKIKKKIKGGNNFYQI
jgi:hypothetical protein